METETTPVRKASFAIEYLKRGQRKTLLHPITRLCKDSRWPFTDELTPQQISCLRDSYSGARRLQTTVNYISNYDRINNPVTGYDQRLHKDNMLHPRTVMCNARDEETCRAVHVEANMIYGRRSHHFYDTANLLCPRTSICHRQFTKGNGMRTLPPLPNLDRAPPPHPDNQRI